LGRFYILFSSTTNQKTKRITFDRIKSEKKINDDAMHIAIARSTTPDVRKIIAFSLFFERYLINKNIFIPTVRTNERKHIIIITITVIN
jgi:hypothetical protein